MVRKYIIVVKHKTEVSQSVNCFHLGIKCHTWTEATAIFVPVHQISNAPKLQQKRRQREDRRLRVSLLVEHHMTYQTFERLYLKDCDLAGRHQVGECL